MTTCLGWPANTPVHLAVLIKVSKVSVITPTSPHQGDYILHVRSSFYICCTMRTLSRTPPCVGQCATRIKVHEPRHDAQLLRSSLAAHHPERIRDANVPHIAHAGICLAVAASMALRCPQALASDEAIFAQHVSNANSVETFSEGTGEGQRSVRDLQGRPFNVECNTIGPCMLDAPQPAITDLADALPTSSDPASYLPEAITTGTYVPGPVEVGWQIYVGSAVAAFPFVIGAYEFGKRILIQRR